MNHLLSEHQRRYLTNNGLTLRFSTRGQSTGRERGWLEGHVSTSATAVVHVADVLGNGGKVLAQVEAEDEPSVLAAAMQKASDLVASGKLQAHESTEWENRQAVNEQARRKKLAEAVNRLARLLPGESAPNHRNTLAEATRPGSWLGRGLGEVDSAISVVRKWLVTEQALRGRAPEQLMRDELAAIETECEWAFALLREANLL